MNAFYVYVLFRDENDVPFYVGKGKGRRWLVHESDALKGEDSYKARIIRKVCKKLGYLPKKKVAEGLTEEQAFSLEKSLIAALRMSGHKLANLTDGGEGPAGYKYTEDQLNKMRAAWQNPDRLSKFVAQTKASWNNPEVRERRITAIKDAWIDPETRVILIKNLEEVCWYNPEVTEKRLLAVKDSWSDPVRRENRLSKMKIALASYEVRQKKSSSSTSTWSDPEIRERRCDGMKMAWTNEELRVKRALAMREGWARRRARLAAEAETKFDET